MLFGIHLTARAMGAWFLAVVMLTAGAYALINMGTGVARAWNQRHGVMSVDNTTQRFRSLGKNSIAIFTPSVDVTGAANCNGGLAAGAVNQWCHEIDFYALDGHNVRYFQAFMFKNGKLQEYTYTDPQLYLNKPPTGLTAVGSGITLSYFQVRAMPLTSIGADSGANPIVKALITQDNLQAKLKNYSVQTAFSGVTITNAIYHVEFGNGYWHTAVDTGVGTMPVVGTLLNVGPFAPTPPPAFSIAYPGGGASLLYYWPAAAQQSFTVSEQNYHDWFAATSGWNCGTAATFPNTVPYSGSQYSGANANNPVAPPAGEPYSYPNPNVAANPNAPATFKLGPSAAGFCTATIQDVYTQTANAQAQVMGWLTLTQGASSATPQTAPLTVVANLQHPGDNVSVSVSKQFDTQAAGTFGGSAVSIGAACSSFLTGGLSSVTQSGQNMAATLTLTVAGSGNQSGSTVNCPGTVIDQFGEPSVAFTVAIKAATGKLIGPSMIEFSSPTVGYGPSFDERVAQLINGMFAGDKASAGNAGCSIAKLWMWNTSGQSVIDANGADGFNATDANGCVQNGDGHVHLWASESGYSGNFDVNTGANGTCNNLVTVSQLFWTAGTDPSIAKPAQPTSGCTFPVESSDQNTSNNGSVTTTVIVDATPTPSPQPFVWQATQKTTGFSDPAGGKGGGGVNGGIENNPGCHGSAFATINVPLAPTSASTKLTFALAPEDKNGVPSTNVAGLSATLAGWAFILIGPMPGYNVGGPGSGGRNNNFIDITDGGGNIVSSVGSSFGSTSSSLLVAFGAPSSPTKVWITGSPTTDTVNGVANAAVMAYSISDPGMAAGTYSLFSCARVGGEFFFQWSLTQG